MTKNRIYKQHYACFNCRKAFKKTNITEVPEQLLHIDEAGRVVSCPQCGERMPDVGYDFNPPRKDDVKGWEKAKREIINTIHYAIQNSHVVNAPLRVMGEKYIDGYDRKSITRKASLIGRSKKQK